MCRLRFTLLPLGVSVLVILGCRPVQERSALAQASAGGRVAVSTAAASSGSTDVTVRRLRAGGFHYFYASSVSPDGRYVSLIDYSTFDLAVRDLPTGKLYRLTNVQGKDSPCTEVGTNAFSRDGRIVFTCTQLDPPSQHVWVQLRVQDFAVDAAGRPRPAESRVIFSNPEYRPSYPFDWSPDGRDILAKVYVAGNANQLALISTTDGRYRALKSFDWREPSLARFSPDGRYVAYDFPPRVDSPDRDVFVMSVDGKHDVAIIDGPAIDRLLGWLPDGSILFYSDRGGTPGVWRVPVADGRASGQPELVKGDMWGVEPLGFAGGRFYYGVTVNPKRLYVATADLAAGRLVSPPVAVADPTRIDVRQWDWSPDGKFLAYGGATPGAQGSIIGLRGIDGKAVRSIHLALNPYRATLLQWDPDGRSLVEFTSDGKGRRGFYRVDLASGTYRTILVTDGTKYATIRGHFALSPDGQALYFTRSDPRAPFSYRELIAFDLKSGTASHVADVAPRDYWSPVAIAPDGSRLAVVYPGARRWEGVVGTIPATGGAFTPLDTIPEGVHVRYLGWTPDNRWIYWTTIRPQADKSPYRLRVAPAAGGTVHDVQLPDGLEGLVRVHPDGRRIAFAAGEPRLEVWVMEGLVEDAAASTIGMSQ